MTTIYLTPSETRRYAIELPVGDPYSGPAYGKKTMPVVAIAAAATSFASGVAAFSAATTLGGMIAAGATIVGSALTIIGTVTGNSKLAKIGGILAIGGMVGTGLVNSAAEAAGSVAGDGAAAAAGDMALTEGGAINEAARFSDAAFDAGMPGAASAAPSASALPAGRGLIDMDQAINPMTDARSQALVDAQVAAKQPAGSATTQVSVESPFQAGTEGAMDTSATEVGQSNQMNVFDPEMAKLERQQAIAQGGNKLGGYFDKFGRWVKDNKELAYLGANFASGLFPSEKDKAAAEKDKAEAEAYKRRALWATGRTA